MPKSTVAVTLDWSRFAEAALPVAVRLARALDARLRIIMVHEPITAPVPAAELPIAIGPDDVAVREARQTYLAGVARDLGRINGAAIEVSLIEGAAGPSLVDDVARTEPAVLVMATHGRGPISRLWLGSVADHMIRHASVPVLLIRPASEDPEPAPAPAFKAALVPLDRSDDAEAILDPLLPIARATGARITLLHVIQPVLGVADAMSPYPALVPQDVLTALREEAERYLEDVARRLRAAGIEVSCIVAEGLGVAPTILEQLAGGGHDFVAMSTHGAGGLQRVLLGSVADKVVRGSFKPVLVVRPDEADD